MLAAFRAFGDDRSSDGIAHLERMEQLIDYPPTLAGALQMLLRAFPEDEALEAFARPRLEEFAAQMPPAQTVPGPTTEAVPETVPPETGPAVPPLLRRADPQTAPSDGPLSPNALQ